MPRLPEADAGAVVSSFPPASLWASGFAPFWSTFSTVYTAPVDVKATSCLPLRLSVDECCVPWRCCTTTFATLGTVYVSTDSAAMS
jgi:hypothetical protein